jgi:hypothetical protein
MEKKWDRGGATGRHDPPGEPHTPARADADRQYDPESAGVDLSLLERISPIGWENTLWYAEYLLDPSLVLV